MKQSRHSSADGAAGERAAQTGHGATFLVTLKLDEVSLARLENLRQRYFPVELNHVPAHVTLLHRLCAEQAARLIDHAPDLFAEPCVQLDFSDLRLLGQGVAVQILSGGLDGLRQSVVGIVAGELSRQDQQGYKPHVTIQNKVSPAVARETWARMSESFIPWRGVGKGLLIWRYLGGPWSLARELPFCDEKCSTRACLQMP